MSSFHPAPQPEIGTGTSKSEDRSSVSKLDVERRWTISNILSVSRILLTAPIVVLILDQKGAYRATILILMLVAVATDFFDGLLARALKQVTDFGKLLDPVADKICIITAAAALVLAGDIPLWYAGLVAFRDALIVVGSSLIISRRKVVVQSVWAGKLTVSFIAAYLILAVMNMDSLSVVKYFFLYLSTVALLISLAVYVRVYQKYMGKNGVG